MVAFALLYLIAYAVPIAYPNSSATIQGACAVTLIVIWIIFAVDYLARLWLAPDRKEFFRSHILDLLVVALPMLRPLSMLRAIMVMQILNRAWRRSTRNQVVIYAAGSSALLILMGALTITETERDAPGTTITNLGTGFWWAITTMTTVGYGDTYPVTTTGRFIAAVLMIGGVAVLGVLTATLSSWLVERVTDEDDAEHNQTQAQLEAMSLQLQNLSKLLGNQAANPETAAATVHAVHAVENAAKAVRKASLTQSDATAPTAESKNPDPEET